MLVFAAAGGLVGWRLRGWLVRTGSFKEPRRPDGVTREAHTRRLVAWRKRRRFAWVIAFIFLGALAGFVALLMFGLAVRVFGG